MAYDLDRIKREFTEACGKANVKVTVPISINRRLTRTLGMVREMEVRATGYLYATSVEFSQKMLDTCEDESISEVIKHEAAHYILVSRTHESHGHDAKFKAICAKIGAEFNTPHGKMKHLKEAKSMHKYDVICPNCGSIGGYDRMCKTLKNIEYCSCKRCKSNNLTYIQNW